MFLVDTSIWVDIFRDATGARRHHFEALVDIEEVRLTPFTELELLQGCRDDKEWALLSSYLKTQDYLEPIRQTWSRAARIFFELRRVGRTVGSPIDCCIAQLAVEHGCLLVHRDRDFETIAQVRPLSEQYLEWPADAH